MTPLVRRITLSIFFTLFIPGLISAQREEWSCLVPLESSRADIESILGEPAKYFDTYGTYETPYAKYSVWYSSGFCGGKVEGRDWNITAGKMTNMIIDPKHVHLVNVYLSNLKDFDKKESPGGYSRYLYVSRDQSHIYKTIKRPDSSEIIESIILEPGKNKEKLLCTKKKE